ncbi:MAG: hypothetical protein KDK30_00895 [Leptospiraceae bacterium]|nr:hypothetical protein [Leptospiraceae bacterium]MCB1316991.1 hypothetical protein [Leptospiraceae bacterium]
MKAYSWIILASIVCVTGATITIQLNSTPSETISYDNFLTNPYSRLVRNFIETELQAGNAEQLQERVDSFSTDLTAGTYSASEEELNAFDSNLNTIIGTAEAMIIEGTYFDPFDETRQTIAIQQQEQEMDALEATFEPGDAFEADFAYFQPEPNDRGYQERKKDLIEAAYKARNSLREMRGQL